MYWEGCLLGVQGLQFTGCTWKMGGFLLLELTGTYDEYRKGWAVIHKDSFMAVGGHHWVAQLVDLQHLSLLAWPWTTHHQGCVSGVFLGSCQV